MMDITISIIWVAVGAYFMFNIMMCFFFSLFTKQSIKDILGCVFFGAFSILWVVVVGTWESIKENWD